MWEGRGGESVSLARQRLKYISIVRGESIYGEVAGRVGEWWSCSVMVVVRSGLNIVREG